MSIADLLAKNPLVLAPLAGVTDLPFRMLCRELGAGIVYSEMISAEALIRDHRRTLGMLRTDPAERPVAFQIFGNKPETLASAARIISGIPVDFIDINMGCPVPKVLKSGAGAALLRDPGLAREIMAAVTEASSLPVTVKIRLGWDAGSIVAEQVAQAAEAAGIAAIAVHARTRSQGFSGSADWSMIRAVREAVSLPVIGNGDVRRPQDAQRMIDETGCHGVMIGRAVQGNPWIFREAKAWLESRVVLPPPTSAERRAVMLRHLRDVVAILGEDTGVREMRKHLCWYTRGVRGGAEFRRKANALVRMDDVVRLIDEYFSSGEAAHVPASWEHP